MCVYTHVFKMCVCVCVCVGNQQLSILDQITGRYQNQLEIFQNIFLYILI